MEERNIFEYAIKNKLRFNFKGIINTEDLWDLSVQNLDAIYKKLNQDKKSANEESLLNTRTKTDVELEIKIDIVKFIVGEKLKEIEENKNAAAKKIKKQEILKALDNKKKENLNNMSEEELQKMYDELK